MAMFNSYVKLPELTSLVLAVLAISAAPFVLPIARHWSMVIVFLMIYFAVAYWTTPMGSNIPW